jgi:hypothetical protein
LRVLGPSEWKEEIESRALPASCFHPGSVLKELPIYEHDLPPKHLPNTSPEPTPVAPVSSLSRLARFFRRGTALGR